MHYPLIALKLFLPLNDSRLAEKTHHGDTEARRKAEQGSPLIICVNLRQFVLSITMESRWLSADCWLPLVSFVAKVLDPRLLRLSAASLFLFFSVPPCLRGRFAPYPNG